MQRDVEIFMQKLKTKLTPLYTLPNAPGGHDVWHVVRVAGRGERIRERCNLEFDLEEFEVAVWLHNIDRVHPYCRWIAISEELGESFKEAFERNLKAFFLEGHPFSAYSKERIIDAVVQHSKKDDEPGDSHLLTALRIADKLDRLNPVGFLSAVVGSGVDLPIYDPSHPFGEGITVEKYMKSVYDSFFRLLEWVPMLPSDNARSLIVKEDLRACINLIRAVGKQLAREHNVPDVIEGNIKKALGPHYAFYACE